MYADFRTIRFFPAYFAYPRILSVLLQRVAYFRIVANKGYFRVDFACRIQSPYTAGGTFAPQAKSIRPFPMSSWFARL